MYCLAYALSRVVCAQLGWQHGFASLGGRYGAGSGRIWLDNLRCSGDEGSLSQCLHNGWGVTNCDHSMDAGVDCFNERG